MRRLLALVFLALAIPALAGAQTATVTPTNKFGFNEQGPDLATIQAYTYRVYADAVVVGTPTVAVCTAPVLPDTTGFTCTFPVPPFAPGSHTLALSAANAAGESAKSAPISFTMIITPGTPGGLRIQ